MTTATKAGTTAFCKQPGRCMIRCHDCGCDEPDGPYYCELDHPYPGIRAHLAEENSAGGHLLAGLRKKGTPA